MIENNQAIVLWKRCLDFIRDNVKRQREYDSLYYLV